MQKSDQIGSLVTALAKAQMELRNPPLDSVNPHFKNRYASLGAHLDAIRTPLAKNGLVLTQMVTTESGCVHVTTMIAHASGEWMSSTVGMPLPERATAQNLGATVTYLRRYAIGACALLTGDEDNDAESDRIARQDKPRAAPAAKSEDVFDPTPAAKSPVAKSPAAKTKPERRWKERGTDVVIVTKIVAREDGRSAVLCQHATDGSQWVSISDSLMDAAVIEVDKRIELTWTLNQSGHVSAVAVAEPPRLAAAMKAAEVRQ